MQKGGKMDKDTDKFWEVKAISIMTYKWNRSQHHLLGKRDFQVVFKAQNRVGGQLWMNKKSLTSFEKVFVKISVTVDNSSCGY